AHGVFRGNQQAELPDERPPAPHEEDHQEREDRDAPEPEQHVRVAPGHGSLRNSVLARRIWSTPSPRPSAAKRAKSSVRCTNSWTSAGDFSSSLIVSYTCWRPSVSPARKYSAPVAFAIALRVRSSRSLPRPPPLISRRKLFVLSPAREPMPIV